MSIRASWLRWRFVPVAFAASSVLLVGCGSDEPGSVSAAPDEPTSNSVSSETPSETPVAASPLEGSWQAEPITLEQSEATIRRHGLGEWVEEYRKNAPFSGDTLLSLTIEGGAWDLYGESDGGPSQPIDYDAEYEIAGDKVVFHHSDGSNTYRWRVDGDTLQLRFEKSTLPGYRGIPEEVFQRALYMTATFSKQT